LPFKAGFINQLLDLTGFLQRHGVQQLATNEPFQLSSFAFYRAFDTSDKTPTLLYGR